MAPVAALALAARTRAFWILAGTFFICGASTNGLIGTHLIAACHDVGISAIRSTQLLALMGIFDIVGTTASGWLTDRYSARHLLFAYYSLRGLSLLFLPAANARAICDHWDEMMLDDRLSLLDDKTRRWVEPALDDVGRRFIITDFEAGEPLV